MSVEDVKLCMTCKHNYFYRREGTRWCSAVSRQLSEARPHCMGKLHEDVRGETRLDSVEAYERMIWAFIEERYPTNEEQLRDVLNTTLLEPTSPEQTQARNVVNSFLESIEIPSVIHISEQILDQRSVFIGMRQADASPSVEHPCVMLEFYFDNLRYKITAPWGYKL